MAELTNGAVDYEQLNTLVSSLKSPTSGTQSVEQIISNIEEEIAKDANEMASLLKLVASQQKKLNQKKQLEDVRKQIIAMGISDAVYVSADLAILVPADKSVGTNELTGAVAESSVGAAKPKTFSDIASKPKKAKNQKLVSESQKPASESQKPTSDLQKIESKKPEKKPKTKAVSKTPKKDENLAAIVFNDKVMRIQPIGLGDLLYMTTINKLQHVTPKESGGFGIKRHIKGPGYEIEGQNYNLTFHVADQGSNLLIGLIERDGAKAWILAEYNSNDDFIGYRPLTQILGTSDFQIGELNQEVEFGEIMFPFNYAEFTKPKDIIHGIWASDSVLEMLNNPTTVWDSHLA